MTSELLTLPGIRLPEGRIQLAPHRCFACGTLNDHGLRLELHAASDRCWTELSLADRFAGWDGIAHGGIVTTILDEVMAWALIEHDHWGVTARMTVEFKRPVPIGRPIRAEGWVTDVRRRVIGAAGRVVDGHGTVLATSAGTYVGASEVRKAELKARYQFAVVPDEPDVAASGGDTRGGTVRRETMRTGVGDPPA